MLKNYKHIIKNNFFILGYLWRSRKSYIFINVGMSAINSIMNLGEIWLLKLFIDSLTSGEKLWTIIIIIVLYALAVKLHELLYNYVYQFEFPKASYAINRALTEDIMKKSVSIDMYCFDNTEFYDKYTEALAETSQRTFDVLNTMSSFVYSVISIIGLLSMIIAWEPIVFGLAILLMISNLIFINRSNKVIYDRDMELTPYNRYMNYCKGTFFSRAVAKDLRLYPNISEYLKANFSKYMSMAQDIFTSKTKKLYFYSATKMIITCITEIILPLTYLAVRCLAGAITIGSVTALWESMKGVANTLSGFSYNYSQMKKSSLYIDNLRFILNYEPKIKTPEHYQQIPSEIDSIQFHNVYFRYNEEGEYVLQDINITINSNEKVAFVGHNGAGKSTLIKLVLRLYDPTSGCITLNGTDIKNFNLNEYRSLFVTLFQDFSLFAVPVCVNVLGRPIENIEDEKLVIEAMKEAGIYDRIISEEKGINSEYTREFDENGVLLSGGEAQKLALSRIFADKNSKIVILDEPSSALDVESEHHLYENLIKNTEGKISLMISHRLSATINSDKIFFMENGRVKEQGTHEELMQYDGKYKYVFNLQAQKYRGENAQLKMKELNYE